jgi:hypothetical protein
MTGRGAAYTNRNGVSTNPATSNDLLPKLVIIKGGGVAVYPNELGSGSRGSASNEMRK